MLFSSMVFLWIFLPLVLVINFLLSKIKYKNEKNKVICKNYFLLCVSFIFYAWGGIYYFVIMLVTILINYLGGFLVGDDSLSHNVKKRNLIIVIGLNLTVLFIFKYFNLAVIIAENIISNNMAFGERLGRMLCLQGTGELGFASIVLPIGISFFTFQSMSYVIDVYREKVSIQKNFFNFALYVSLFPQLIAGPIVKYIDIEKQINERNENIDLFLSGQKKFCYGLAKKVILSNSFAELVDSVWKLNISEIGSPIAWMGIIAYTLQIYYDFSGYSDMAIGIGRMLGFRFKENFNYPYISTSIKEFWRRWHISLTDWFREYVYFPLGGNRKGVVRTYINIFIVFLLTGIWHGANFTFIVWGLIYSILQIIERAFLGKILDRNPIKIFNWLYTMMAVMIAWVFFRSDNVFQALEYIKQLFAGFGDQYYILSYISLKEILCFVIGILFAGIIQNLFVKTYSKYKNKTSIIIIDYAVQYVLLGISIMLIISGTYNPFIYFQF